MKHGVEALYTVVIDRVGSEIDISKWGISCQKIYSLPLTFTYKL